MADFGLEEEQKLMAHIEDELSRDQVNVDFLSFVANHKNCEKEEEEDYKPAKTDLRKNILSLFVVEKYKRVLAPAIDSFDTEGRLPAVHVVYHTQIFSTAAQGNWYVVQKTKKKKT